MVLYGKAELGAWDVQARREVYRIALGEDRGPRLSVLSPDGRVAAGVGEGGISVRLVEATGRELGTLATTERVSRIAFSPDGRTVAATSNDQTTQISDIANLARVRKIATRGAGPLTLQSQVVDDFSRWPITRRTSTMRFSFAARRGLRLSRLRAPSFASRFRPTSGF